MNSLRTVSLGEICDFINGGTPSKSIDHYFRGNIPWITGADITSSIVNAARSFITEEAIKNSATNLVPAGTVLLVTRTSVGKVALAGISLCFSQDITAIFPDEKKLDAKYLVHFLKSQEVYFKQHQRGATIQGITREVLAQSLIPFPSLPEQRRIAAILDKADSLREKRRQAIAKLDELLKSVFIEMFGDPMTNPKGWEIIKVGEAGRVQLGRQRAPKYQSGKFTRPYVRVANVFEDRIDVTDVLKMDFDENDFEQYRLQFGDILLNEGQSTELVGRPAMWRNEIKDCCFQNTLVRFQPHRIFTNSDYSLTLFLNYFRASQFAKISSKTSNVAHLGAGRFAAMPFLLPPRQLQDDFSRKYERIRKLKIATRSSLQRFDALFQSLQYRAFSGELFSEKALLAPPPVEVVQHV